MRAICAVIALLILMSSHLMAADQSAEAKAILEKAIKAHGGAEKLSKIKAQSWKVNGEMHMGDKPMKYSGEYTFASPDCFRFDIEINPGEKMTISAGTDGKIAWEKMFDEMRNMREEKRKAFDHNVYAMGLGHLIMLNDKAFNLSPLGESRLGEQTLVGIKVSREGHRDVSLFFDKTTGLLTKSSTTNFEPDFEQKEITQDVVFSGYKDKDGIKAFDKLTIFHDGNKYIVEEISDRKLLDKVDPAKFAKPKDAK